MTTFSFTVIISMLLGSALAAYPYYFYLPVNQSSPYRTPQYLVPVYGTYGMYKVMNRTDRTEDFGPNDFVLGSRKPSDQLLFQNVIYQKPGAWSSHASKEVRFPPYGSSAKVNITKVVARDIRKNARKGSVSVTKGGIGHENVTLMFRSEKNMPINYILRIYGIFKK